MLAVKLRLPIDSPLPERTRPKVGVLLMLGAGGLVALVVVLVFGLMLFEMIKGG
jgi:hypothetical protein